MIKVGDRVRRGVNHRSDWWVKKCERQGLKVDDVFVVEYIGGEAIHGPQLVLVGFDGEWFDGGRFFTVSKRTLVVR